ncbi:multidrug effflux MFS transporter [Catellatospora citrea]|uniref:Bcr/CflA family drug resistance efflux transporter n=1 Tax=Catellatospora citrea TaxID=53366 RepID=A0A8J3P5Q4_9ACTN|nr:multidrug effflux MFS transporter [Catellatospora citrea]RKE06428.1 DHA1 family bicyclomycin/chloramphenicol resistance-like MFS transporter [Catellatospora citrea]GIG02591.1 Bcr/CflA family drug resistance efflux transporter [Catellatospora citrea]
MTPAPAQRRILILVLGSMSAFGALSFDMYLPAFPTIAADLRVSPAAVQLTLTVALIGIALGQFVMGPLSDRWGRRRPIVAGTALFFVSSALITVAPNIETMTALRLVQGFAGGIGIAISRAVVRDLYSGAEASRFFSRLTLVFGVAPVVAPTIGAAVLEFTSWRGVFALLALYGLIMVVVGWRFLPETLPVERRRTGGLAEVGRGFKVLAADRRFWGYTAAQGLTFAGLFAYLSSGSFVLQEVYGVSAQAYGLIFGVNALGLVAVGQLNARLVGRRTPRALLFAALAGAVAAGILMIGGAGLHSLTIVVAMLFVYIASLGMVAPNSTALALDGHAQMAGTAAALMGAVQSVIGAIAGPIVAALGASSGMPMAAAMFGFAALSVVTATVLTRPGQPKLA